MKHRYKVGFSDHETQHRFIEHYPGYEPLVDTQSAFAPNETLVALADGHKIAKQLVQLLNGRHK